MASCSIPHVTVSPDSASVEASAETVSPLPCDVPSVPAGVGGGAGNDNEYSSSDDELARTLDAAWDDDDGDDAPPAKLCRLEPTAAESAVFGTVDLVARIATFSPSLHLSQLAALNRCWDGATQVVWRQRACGVLAEAMPLPIAVQVEACVHAHCGARAGPGAYNAKVRQLALNLRGNAGLAARVRAGAVPPDLLVRLPSDEMRTAAAERRDERWRRAAAEAAVRRPPPAHVVNVYRCPACGNPRQWLRRRVRLTDITMATGEHMGRRGWGGGEGARPTPLPPPRPPRRVPRLCRVLRGRAARAAAAEGGGGRCSEGEGRRGDGPSPSWRRGGCSSGGRCAAARAAACGASGESGLKPPRKQYLLISSGTLRIISFATFSF